MPLLLSHNLCRILHFLLFLCPYSAKKHRLSLKLSLLLYQDDQYGILLIFFFSAVLVSPPIRHTSKIYHRWKNLFVQLVNNLFLFLYDIFVYFILFQISLIVTGNSSMMLQSMLFISISNLSVAITVSSNGSHCLGINLDNSSACPNIIDRRNSI